MKPLIGVSGYVLREQPERDWLYIPQDYFRAVQTAGGIPVLLPLVAGEDGAAEVLDRVDGLLLSGGGDPDPQLYGEQPHPRLGIVSPERDTAELALARLALQRNMPVLGVCRGHQVLAVASGGSLYQDIPAQVAAHVKHDQTAPRWYATHRVRVQPGTRLASLLGLEFQVNSFHHQAVKSVPGGWVLSAAAADGVNEAMEHPGHRFVLSVQWHPECFHERSPNFAALFDAFVGACMQ